MTTASPTFYSADPETTSDLALRFAESTSPGPEGHIPSEAHKLSQKKPRKMRSSPTGDDHSKLAHSLLSTSSPEGLAAAARVTPNRIAGLLLKQGPLPIRHITGHLASQINGFSSLSLSKQRRLIISALELGDPITGCVFEKIGWGQWEARKVSEEEVRLRNSKQALSTSPPSANSSFGESLSRSAPKSIKKRHSNVDDVSLVSPRSAMSFAVSASASASNSWSRRESITNPATDPHNAKLPVSPSLNPIQSLRNSFRGRQISLDEAIESSSDEEGLEFDDGDGDGYEEDGGMFAFDNDDSDGKSYIRSNSVTSTHRRPSFGGIMKPRKPRASFNSQTIEAALDGNSIEGGLDAASVPESIVSRRRPRASFNNASSLSRQSFLRTNISPNTDPLTMHDSVSNIAINKVSSTENVYSASNSGAHSETDEEDWESIGAASLRRASALTPPTPLLVDTSDHKNGIKDDEMAAMVLMDLKAV
ncbi:unnamed protein product [Kuraishia capsulata CBS 1993]|uniref:Protein STB3 n=1 Tax=Kuraishia capsulata CBS 1993 TaxID=1382522 RepID=W6MXZ8_9ASCO|nr:uncharacterized protein KUCA_T00005753001 [Kuraishia capsulata CBS 1993]CDK29760.1 unnamed protein product [Kuraishia capsulata CBS 1993]